jgi:hypothetical protein
MSLLPKPHHSLVQLMSAQDQRQGGNRQVAVSAMNVSYGIDADRADRNATNEIGLG